MKQKLTLDRAVIYEIRLLGHLDENWTAWDEGMNVTVAGEEDEEAVTVLCGRLDQAGLQSLLRRIYNSGRPLISATWIADD
jgi:hypothetical protein